MEKQYCSTCMDPFEGDVCPHCGAEQVQNRPGQLPCGTILIDRYYVGKCLGQGGFGITYIGRDLRLDKIIALKEYYPASFVRQRGGPAEDIAPLNDETKPYYEEGKAKFLQEARLLAQFSDDPNIVLVTDYFSDHNTAYIVMEYLNGQSLSALLRAEGPQSVSRVLELLKPVMESLDNMHRQSLLHRDISPANLLLLNSGKVKLLDFGSARQIASESNQNMTVFTKAGYTPVEQYAEDGEQGPWSDVYSLCGTIYKLITGVTPDSSLTRSYRDTLKKPSELGVAITCEQEDALMKGLAIRREDRFQSMSELLSALYQPKEEDDEKTCWGGASSLPTASAALSNTVSAAAAPVSRNTVRLQPVCEPDSVTLPCAESVSDNKPEDGKQRKKKNTADKKPREKKKSKRLRWIIIAIISVIVIVMVALFAFQKELSYASFYNETPTVSDIREVRRSHTDSLYMTDCVVSDEVMEQISHCTDLTSVKLERCSGFQNLYILARLSNLTNLTIIGDENTATEVSLMLAADFPKVTSLTIEMEVLSTADFLAHFPALKSLEIQQCLGTPEQLDALSSLLNLTSITINGWDLSQAALNPLTNLSGLNTLQLNYCGLTDVSALSSMTGLVFLELSNNSIEDISFLTNMYELDELNLNSNPIADFSPLTELPDILSLWLDETGLPSLDICLEMVHLKTVSAAGNNLGDINGLANCSVLRYVNLENNNLTDVSLLKNNLSTLYIVRLSGNELTDISWLRGAEDLYGITIAENQLTTLDGLQDSTDLKVISAYGNQLEDVEPISGCDNLVFIDFGENNISDISALHLCTYTEYLFLQNNHIEDISALDLSALHYCETALYGNPISTLLLDGVGYRFQPLYITYDEGLDLSLLSKSSIGLNLVDTPMVARGKISESIFTLEYLSSEEADELIAPDRDVVSLFN